MPTTLMAGLIGLLICLIFKDTAANRKRICVFVCICFILQAGMRDYMHATNDTYNYLRSYWALLQESLPETIQKLKVWDNTYQTRDPGYDIFVKITQLINPDFRFFLILVAAIISIPLTKLIYDYTTSIRGIVLAVIVYEALFANFFETGIRQTITMGILYASLPAVISRNWKLHFSLLALAATMHSSALIFFPFYFLVNLKVTKKLLLGAIVLTPIFMIVAPQLIIYLGEGTIFESYANTQVDNLGTPVFSVLLVAIAAATFVFRKNFDENNIKDRVLLTAIVCSLVLMPSTWVNSNFLRLVLYYLVFLMPVVPRLVDSAAGDNILDRNFYAVACGLILILLSWH